MAELSKSAASLRFIAADLDPDEITDALGKQPHASHRTGETIRSPSGQERIAKQGAWSLTAERRKPGDIDVQVDELLSGTTDDLEIWQKLTSKYKTDLFFGLFLEEWNEGLPIAPYTLKRIGERGILIDLDIYAPILEQSV